ncbi:hypothetical protein LV75_006841 [Actinokineospora diospyrosa]|uniref:Uncharacterized protein n=1 Tax=Actinokineospora diospyrosa TaxID=103728 RepID=A0ABT1INR4_9PSEU|nr:hypothetical protein [Actinokineospora diospyrosa]
MPLSCRQVRPNPLAQPWTLGLGGAIPAHPRLPCQPSPRSSESLVPTARWGGLVLRGGTTPVASSAAGPAFGPLLCGSASGVVGAPRKTSSPHRAFRIVAFPADVAARRRGVHRSRRRRPRIPCPALPTTAYVKINLIESPQIHSLPRSTDKPGAANAACGQQKTLWTTTRHNPLPQDQLDREPPIYSLPSSTDRRGAASSALWTTRTVVDKPPHKPLHRTPAVRKTRRAYSQPANH